MPNFEDYLSPLPLADFDRSSILQTQKMTKSDCGITKANEGFPPPFGAEVVGRKMSIYIKEKRSWASAMIQSYDAAAAMHNISINGSEARVSLGSCRFKWSSRSLPNDTPNPSFIGSPQGNEAVGRRVRVFWPGMGRYYQGIVKSYDGSNGKHRIDYCDGDWAEHDLRHEAVAWLDSDSPGSPVRMPPPSQTGHTASAPQDPAPPRGQSSPRKGEGREVSPVRVGQRRRTAEDMAGRGSRKRVKRVSGSGRGGADEHDEEEEEEEEEEQEEAIEPIKLTVGARIAMSNDGGVTYTRARMSGYHPSDGRHRIRFDDNTHRLLNMRGKPFLWVAPRGRAAGYCSRLHGAMVQLGACNIHPSACSRAHPKPCPGAIPETSIGAYDSLPSGFSVPAPASPKEAVGRRLCLLWQADGRWYQGQVLQHSSDRGQYHVLYCDGEDEWLDLSAETVAWGPLEKAPPEPFGIRYGASAPEGRSAIGWRVGVFWRDDSKFYEGTVTGYDSSTGRHQVEYDDGQEEAISVATETVVWRAAPSSGLAAQQQAAAPAAAAAAAGAGGRSRRPNAGRGGRAVQGLAEAAGRGGPGGKAPGRTHRGRGGRQARQVSSSDYDEQDEDTSQEEGTDEEQGDVVDLMDTSDEERPSERRSTGAAHRPQHISARQGSFGSPVLPAVQQQQQQQQPAGGIGRFSMKAGLSFVSPEAAAPAAPAAVALTSGSVRHPSTPPLHGFSFPAPTPSPRAGSGVAPWSTALLNIQQQVKQQQSSAMPPPPLPRPSGKPAGPLGQIATSRVDTKQQQQQQGMDLVTPRRIDIGAAVSPPAAAMRAIAGTGSTAFAEAPAGPDPKGMPAPDVPVPDVPLPLLEARLASLNAMLQCIAKGERQMGLAAMPRSRYATYRRESHAQQPVSGTEATPPATAANPAPAAGAAVATELSGQRLMIAHATARKSNPVRVGSPPQLGALTCADSHTPSHSSGHEAAAAAAGAAPASSPSESRETSIALPPLSPGACEELAAAQQLRKQPGSCASPPLELSRGTSPLPDCPTADRHQCEVEGLDSCGVVPAAVTVTAVPPAASLAAPMAGSDSLRVDGCHQKASVRADAARLCVSAFAEAAASGDASVAHQQKVGAELQQQQPMKKNGSQQQQQQQQQQPLDAAFDSALLKQQQQQQSPAMVTLHQQGAAMLNADTAPLSVGGPGIASSG